MGLKSKEIEHLLIRRLKPTANGPVTIPALLMTDGLLLNSSNLSKSELSHYQRNLAITNLIYTT